jgi:hypothetical protein
MQRDEEPATASRTELLVEVLCRIELDSSLRERARAGSIVQNDLNFAATGQFTYQFPFAGDRLEIAVSGKSLPHAVAVQHVKIVIRKARAGLNQLFGLGRNLAAWSAPGHRLWLLAVGLRLLLRRIFTDGAAAPTRGRGPSGGGSSARGLRPKSCVNSSSPCTPVSARVLNVPVHHDDKPAARQPLG